MGVADQLCMGCRLGNTVLSYKYDHVRLLKIVQEIQEKHKKLLA